jgi:aryl-alcohol dehydrogenase-like predicted oxidoreductase
MTTLASYRLLGRSGLRVSPLSLGTMTFGAPFGSAEDESRLIFDAYADKGGNFIDTANGYARGAAESMVGAFARGRREKLVIATKYSMITAPGDPNSGGNHRKNMMHSAEASLRRLQTDYIDLFYVHLWDGTTPVEEILRGLDDLCRQGKILYAGVSDIPAWQAARMQTTADLRGWLPLIALQIRYNLVDRSPERDLIPMARELGLGVTPWSPLAMGVLTGKYAPGGSSSTSLRKDLMAAVGPVTDRSVAIASAVQEIAAAIGVTPARVAIAWLLTNTTVTAPIIGARTLAQFEDNVQALDIVLDSAHLERLNTASAIDPGFPHDFLASDIARNVLFRGVNLAIR